MVTQTAKEALDEAIRKLREPKQAISNEAMDEVLREVESQPVKQAPPVFQPPVDGPPELSMAERIALFEGENVREGSPFARMEPRGVISGAARAAAPGVEPALNALDAISPNLVFGASGDAVLLGLRRAGLIPEDAGASEQTGEAIGIIPALFGGINIDIFNRLKEGQVFPSIGDITEDPRDILERQRGRSFLPRLVSEALNPVDLLVGGPIAGARGALRAAPGRLKFNPQSLITDRPPTFQPAQAIGGLQGGPVQGPVIRQLSPEQIPPSLRTESLDDAIAAADTDIARLQAGPTTPETDLELFAAGGQQRFLRDTRRTTTGIPDPTEVSGIEAARANLDAAQTEFRTTGNPKDLRGAESAAKEAELTEFIGPKLPDPPPVTPPPPGTAPLGPPEIPPLRGRADKARFPWERPDQVALDLHASAITNEERRAGLEVRDGSKALRDIGLGRTIRGQWVPRPEDIPRIDELFDALHHPSEIAAGTRQIPAGMEKIYERLRNLTDWEQAARLDFDPNMATIDDYFDRGWKPPEGAFTSQQGSLVRNPSFKHPRSEATYREMRELGFQPLSWNPFDQWRISRMRGVKYRQQMELVDFLKAQGEEFIRPSQGGTPPKGFRTPEIGPAFEGKPFALVDEEEGTQQIITTGRWITRNDVANSLENTYGKRPKAAALNIGGQDVDVLGIVDWLVFVPKRVKLFGSFFQPVDFLTRAGIGGFEAGFNALRTGHPVESIKHVVGYPGTAVEIIGSFFSPNWRKGLAQRLDNTTPIRADRPNIHMKVISESGLNLTDPSLFNQDPLSLDKMVREVVEEGRAAKIFKTAPRAVLELERMMREGLFGGVYPAAIINDVRKNIAPQMMRTYPDLTDEQMARAIAHAANVKFSSLPANQSIIQARWLRGVLTRVMFSLNENEGLLRQATKTLPVGFRLTKNPKQILTSGSGFSKFWADHWVGAFLFLTATANLVHFASTGKPLPLDRYRPISSEDWGPLPFGYNPEFASPNIPLTGKGGTEIMVDLVGQMDTALKVLNPTSFIGARRSVPASAFRNQLEADDFYGRPIDEEGPGGVYSRTTQLLQDLFGPIGLQGATSVAVRKIPALEPFVSAGEEKLSDTAQLIQGLGINLRSETIDDAARRLNPNFDQLGPKRQDKITSQMILDVYGPKTRRDKERFQEEIWELFGQPTDAEREKFNDKMDEEFGNRKSVPAPPTRFR